MQKSKSKKFCKVFKGLDRFGYSVTLKYKNKSEYHTVFGASVTLIIFCGIFGYFLYLMKIVFNRESFSVINSLAKRDIVNDPYKLHLTKNNFDIGLYLYYNGNTTI